MKIVEVSVIKLFGIFDHNIPLNLDKHITIIHGPNGIGKTFILKMIKGLLNKDYTVFNKIPFKEFKLKFDDDHYLWVTKENGSQKENNVNKQQLKIHYGISESESIIYIPKPTNIDSRYVFSLKGEQLKEDWDFINYQVIQNNFEAVYLDDISKKSKKGDINLKNQEKIDKIVSKLKVHFIETQRLLNEDISHRKTRDENKKLKSASQLAVEIYSREIAKLIQLRLAESAELSQSLDSSFPIRLVNYKEGYDLDKEEIRTRLVQIDNKRKRLKEAGILVEDKQQEEFHGLELMRSLEYMDETTRSILSVYVNDSESKLNFFDELLNKIELLKKLVKKKYLYKHLFISKEDGFIFKTDAEHTLGAGDLSSGEQHELVLLYELLFKVQPNSLILIDEPELSLHVGWQMTFLSDLKEITEQNNIDLLIATHSPEVIDDNWELTVKLRGPRNV